MGFEKEVVIRGQVLRDDRFVFGQEFLCTPRNKHSVALKKRRWAFNRNRRTYSECRKCIRTDFETSSVDPAKELPKHTVSGLFSRNVDLFKLHCPCSLDIRL